MDLGSILPLLMSKSGVGGDKMNTLMKFAHGEKPDIGTVMNMAMEQKKQAPQGLAPVADIASAEIFGKLAKHFITAQTN